MTSEQVAKYAAMDQRVLVALREHGPQFINQLWARVVLPEMQALAEGRQQQITAGKEDVTAAFWRLLERGAVIVTESRLIILTENVQAPS